MHDKSSQHRVSPPAAWPPPPSDSYMSKDGRLDLMAKPPGMAADLLANVSNRCWGFCHDRADARDDMGWENWWREASKLVPLLHNLALGLFSRWHRSALKR